MKEFDLPMLGLDAPIEVAFEQMIDHQRSGIVCRGGGGDARIVTFNVLEQTLQSGGTTIGDALEYDFAGTVGLNPISLDAILASLESRGLKFGIMRETLSGMRLISVREPYADIYLATPPGAKCTNPSTPHYYPPNRRGLNRKVCILCGFELP